MRKDNIKAIKCPSTRPFFLEFQLDGYLYKGDILDTGSRNHLVVVRSPYDKYHWLRVLLNKVTFGFVYKKPGLFKVKMIKKL